MSKAWRNLTLGDVCKFENGDRGKNYPGRKAFTPSGVPFINAGHLNDGVIDWSSMNYIPEEHFQRLGNGKIRIGDLLFCLRGSLGKFGIVDKDTNGAIASSLVIVRPTDDIDSSFLAAYFRSDICGRMIDRLSNGAAQPNLSAKSLRLFEIPLPPLPEQRRIVAILDEAFAGIATAVANTEKNLANALELFESYLNAVFTDRGEGWVNKRLSEVCDGRITDGTHQTPKYYDSGYIFLSSRNVTSGEIDWEKIKYIDHSQHENMQKRVSPRLGDILLAKNGTTGVAAIVDRDISFDIYVSLALLRPSTEIVSRYLWHFINSPNAKEQFNKRLKGVGVPNLHLNEIREVEIGFPKSILDQERLVEKLDEILAEKRKLESIYQRKLAALAELKQSLLQKAFSGELTAGKEAPNATLKEEKVA